MKKQNPDDETITDWQLELIDTFEQGVERGKAQQKKEFIEMLKRIENANGTNDMRWKELKMQMENKDG